MNEELNLTDEQLRQATSRSLPADGALDSDTAAARESFLALGSAIESAAHDFDQTALLTRLPDQCVSLPEQFARNGWWPLIVSGALAAGMLLAIARIAVERQRSPDRATITQSPTKALPKQKSPIMAPVSLVWSDPLDDEIALAAATIDQFSNTARGFDGSLLDMNDQLQALSRELLGETL